MRTTRPDLDARAVLGIWPTPLQNADERAGIYVKREDLCGFAFGGSKVRALEPLLGEALGREARTIVTGGRRDSNWVALAAAAAAQLGLRCHCVLDPGSSRPSAIALAERFGARVHTARPTGMRTTAASTCCAPNSEMTPAGCRWAGPEDFLLFATEPFGYLRLHDSHCRASVYLPQKRNPYALSVVRGGCAVVTGRAAGVVAAVGTGSAQTDNWIYNYGETLDAVGLATQMSALIAEVASQASFDTARMADRALDGFTDAADLAEHLVAEQHVDYRTAHSLVARLVAAAEQRGESRLSDDDRMSLAGRPAGDPASSGPRSLVTGRSQEGGAAPGQVRASARALHARLARQRTWRLAAAGKAEAATGQLVEQAQTASEQPGGWPAG